MGRIRYAVLTPYIKGNGPTMRVEIWDTYSCDERGCTNLIARLYAFEGGKRTHVLDTRFAMGMGQTDDGNDAMRAAITAVAMKPGDTDEEFFADYTPEALAFVSEHGESMAMVAYDRYGED